MAPHGPVRVVPARGTQEKPSASWPAQRRLVQASEAGVDLGLYYMCALCTHTRCPFTERIKGQQVCGCGSCAGERPEGPR